MKAKEYVTKYKETSAAMDELAALKELIPAFFRELGETLTKRNAVKSNGAGAAVLKEFDAKWRAICRDIPSLKPDGFKDTIRAEYPEVWVLWQQYDAAVRWARTQ